jgi:predicted secreted protein
MKMTFLSFVSVVVLSGCATASGPKAPPVALGPYSTPQKNVTITSRDRGTYVALQPKGTLTVALNSNSSGGYRWKIISPVDPAVLKVIPPAAADNALPPIALAPASLTKAEAEQWTFKAVGPGTARVRMIYSRPNQPLNEAATFDFTVNAE